ncbi:MAG: YggN family protein [Thermoanaerobaculia bacterium]|nr:YggN family protein [Thermoanaerobaculia bacterium]
MKRRNRVVISWVGLYRSVRVATLCLPLAALAAAPCTADILVTKDGRQIETKGFWEVKGRQVIFTAKSGVLSSVRLSEIDLEASELATNPPPPPPAALEEAPEKPSLGSLAGRDRPEPVMVLTNEDIGQADVEAMEDFASAFGGALMELQRALAHGFAEMSDDPEAAKEEIDRQLESQQQELEQGLEDFGKAFEEMLVAVAAVTERYPELQELNPDDPESVRQNAGSIRAAAADLRAAAQQAESPEAREMLNDAAAQMEAKLAGS